jgi:hypothetical protein
MLTRVLRRRHPSLDEAGLIKSKLDPFGRAFDNPVRQKIEALRRRRVAGDISDADFGDRLAELLGAVERGQLTPSDSSGPVPHARVLK